MSETATGYGHVVLSDAGVPVLAGTTMKVVELVSEHFAYGWSPEELHFNHPYLTLGQVYSALAYYWDNKELLDRDMERRRVHVDQMRERVGESETARRLKGMNRS